MSVLKYSKELVFPKKDQTSVKDVLDRLRIAFATKRFSELSLTGDKIHFSNLYLKRLDLLPIPKGWVQVCESREAFQVTYSADYRWAANRRGRLLAILAAMAMVLVTLYKSILVYQSVGGLPSPWFFLVIPIYVALLWLFVYGLNSWYTRLYLAKLIEGLMNIRPSAPKRSS